MTPEPEWVDLGLPSGVLWRSSNLGATRPQSAGLFFSWGNTQGHPSGGGYDFSSEEYNLTPGSAIETDLTLEDDAANVILGNGARIPSDAEFQELINYCSSQWITRDGVNGRLFVSNNNGNSIFLPASGYYIGTLHDANGTRGRYWTSNRVSATAAVRLNFSNTAVTPQGSDERKNGLPIRPVKSA